jgi:hypothetical protein
LYPQDPYPTAGASTCRETAAPARAAGRK